jgi:Uma2 family endonuclease
MPPLQSSTPILGHAELRRAAEEAHSMAMPQITPAQGQWTVEDIRRLPDDGNRYEVIDGVLYVTPAPRLVHQDAVAALHRLLHAYIVGHPVGWALQAPADIVFGPQDGVQPDLFVAPLVELRRPASWKEITRLLLAVEILSPSTASRDRREKRRLYQRHAGEYWIVDLDARLIERWRPGDVRPEVLDETLEWQPAGATKPLVIELPAVFREVWGE